MEYVVMGIVMLVATTIHTPHPWDHGLILGCWQARKPGFCATPKKAISRNRGYLGPPRIPLITGSGALMMVAREYVVVVTTTYPFRLGYTTMVSM